MVVGYDKIGVNNRQLLALPFNEGVGVITKDVAKPEHRMTMNDPGGGSFAWGDVALSGTPYLEFVTIGGGVTDGVYLDCPAAASVDLNFVAGSYSVCGWVNWQSDGFSEIVIGRYGTDLDGWDCYFNAGSFSLSLRHNHATLNPNFSSQCFSGGWGVGIWYFFCITRTGGDLFPLMYRNAVPLAMSYEATGMLDPDTCNRDLVVGCRNTKDANWYKGSMWNLRVWDRALQPWEWKFLFERERHRFDI